MRIKIHPFSIIARLCRFIILYHLLVSNLLQSIKQPGVSLGKKMIKSNN